MTNRAGLADGLGSLHIDELVCPASDLARQNLIAVHPVAGWWKSKKALEAGQQEVRFALIVEIDTEEVNTDIDLYTEITANIPTEIQV